MLRRALGEAVKGLHEGCRAAAWQGICTLSEQRAEHSKCSCQHDSDDCCRSNGCMLEHPSAACSLGRTLQSSQRQGSCTTLAPRPTWITRAHRHEVHPNTLPQAISCVSAADNSLILQGRPAAIAGFSWLLKLTAARPPWCVALCGVAAGGGPPWSTSPACGTRVGVAVCAASKVAQERGLHGMVSVMTAAEAARDLMSAVTQPVAYSELATHLARDYSVELFDALSGLVLCHVDDLSGPELSNVLWAYATVGHHDLRLATTVMQSLSGKLSELQPSHLASALWAMLHMGLYDSQLVTAASEQVWEGLPEATPRHLAAITLCYAGFRRIDQELEEDEDLYRGITARFRAQLGAASPSEIALMLAGMARLRWLDGLLLDEACTALRAAAADTELHVLAEAVWACAALQHRDLPLLEAVADRVTEATRLTSGLLPASAQATSSMSKDGSLPSRPRTDARGIANAVASASSVSAYGNRIERPCSRRPERGALPAAATGENRSRAPQQQHEMEQQQPLLQQRITYGPGFSVLLPTQTGPGGRVHGCYLYERFNPALPDGWRARAAGIGCGGAPTVSSGNLATTATSSASHSVVVGNYVVPEAPFVPASAPPGAASDAAALLDADVVSKFLWSFGALHCYSSALYTLLFRQLARLQDDNVSWSALARLMGAQIKALELQPGPGPSRINPLESESANAWGRLLRARQPLHQLPERLVAPAFVAFSAWDPCDDIDAMRVPEGAMPDTRGAVHSRPSSAVLSRAALSAEVAAALRDLGLELRLSATVDGMFNLQYTALINGITICVEALSAGCCTLEPPHRPLGPAVARLRSLEFRGWKPLVVPFDEWAALSVGEHPHGAAQQAGSDGEAKRARALQEAAVARQRYLRRKLEELLGEELPPLPQKAMKRRMC